MDNNWIVENLTNAFGVWNSKMTEMWSLLTESPQTFKGGTIWQTIVTINGGMQAIGYGLLVLFFAIGIFRSASGFRDFQRPEHLLRHFIYFVLAKLGITYGMDLLVNIFDVCNGIVATAAGSIGGLTGASVALPQEIADAIGDVGFFASIPLWLVTLLGSLFITVLAFIMILTVYGRFFKIYMYAALSPVALASFAGEGTSHFGKAFLRSYVGVCMEGAVIVLACIIFSAFSSSGTLFGRGCVQSAGAGGPGQISRPHRKGNAWIIKETFMDNYREKIVRIVERELKRTEEYQQRRDEYGNEEYILGCIMVKGDAFPKEVIAHAFVEDMGLELQFQIWRDEPRIRQKQAMWYDLTLFDVERDFFGRLEQGYSILGP